MTLKKYELEEIERVVHGLWGSFDGKARITGEQMKSLMDSLRRLDAGVHAVRAAREVYAKSGAQGFRNFARQTAARAFEFQRASRDAEHGAGSAGGQLAREKPDDIAARWDRHKRHAEALYGVGVIDSAYAWRCFLEIHNSGAEWEHARLLTECVFGEDTTRAAMGMKYSESAA